jgi:hypothetical protein
MADACSSVVGTLSPTTGPTLRSGVLALSQPNLRDRSRKP